MYSTKNENSAIILKNSSHYNYQDKYNQNQNKHSKGPHWKQCPDKLIFNVQISEIAFRTNKI